MDLIGYFTEQQIDMTGILLYGNYSFSLMSKLQKVRIYPSLCDSYADVVMMLITLRKYSNAMG